MTIQDTLDKASTNGQSTYSNGTTDGQSTRRKGAKQWSGLTSDPLSDGVTAHTANYICMKGATPWNRVKAGQLFSRSNTGTALWVKLSSGRAISLDTGIPMEVPPNNRLTLSVHLVSSITTTA